MKNDALIDDSTNFFLEINVLNNKKAIENYNQLLLKNWKNHPFYKYEYIHHNMKSGSVLIYFIFRKKNKLLGLLPLIKRKIDIKIDNTTYYDVISPYGYSGPLYIEPLDPEYKSIFWSLLDQWYTKNQIVSEFIRFNLFGNRDNYSGVTIPTLKNVVGTICQDQEKQWNKYLPKVRNNYRKANYYNLSFIIKDWNHLNNEDLKSFFEIYNNTMKRKKASKDYFFPYVYFEELLNNNPTKYFIAFAVINGRKISTELIVEHENKLFAYLGGTFSDFYFCRPNDFLRVEIIKWAAKNNIKNYILGGGMTNDDGVYHHKKAFFPKDTDLNYFTGRKVILKEVYANICYAKFEKTKKVEIKDSKNFFPLYRAS